MKLQIHTEEALEIIKLGEMDPAEVMKYNKDHDEDVLSVMKGVIGLYAGELITAATEAKVQLDLSYETKNFSILRSMARSSMVQSENIS